MDHDQPVGELLREWRHRRRLSQLDLAIQAEVSARHVSFVETGRTVPSRAMVLHLAEQLGVPLRERNRLLVAAGHAPVYRRRPLDDPGLAAVREALGRVLRGHEPYPAVAVDRRWNIVLSNAAAGIFLDGASPALLEPPVNVMRLGLHPDGFAARVRNLPQVRAFLLPRLARQVAQTGDPELSGLYEELVGLGDEREPPPPDPADVALTLRIEYRGEELAFHNTIMNFGVPFDITLEEIAVEAYFPADADTARILRERAEMPAAPAGISPGGVTRPPAGHDP